MRNKNVRIIQICLITLGFSSTFTQIYIIREFLSVLYGNELVIGVVLACWMLLTGAGAYLGKFFIRLKGKLGFILFLQILLAILPFIIVIKLDLWKSIAFPYGSMVGLADILYASFLLQLPFCLINGFLFTAYSSLISEFSGKNRIGFAYAVESIGSVFGGLTVNFILLWYVGTFQSLRVLLVINILSAFLFAWFLCRRRALVLLISVSLAIIPFFFMVDFVKLSQEWLYPKQEVIFNRSTPYGSVAVTKNAGQLNFYENGLLLFSSNNEIFSEEAAHYAMIQHPSPKKILLISGGISGMIKEVQKYKPEQIDYLELNPSITFIGKAFTKIFNDPAIRVYNEDARRFLKRDVGKFDVALINLPEPSTLQINRFYTKEFFSGLKSRLSRDAVVSIGLSSTSDYVSETAGKLNGSLFSTLKGEFVNVLIIPGLKNYFIASDVPLNSDISRLIAQKKIQAVYTNSYYLDDKLLKVRSDFILSHLPAKNLVNYDFSPVTYFYQLQYWTSYFKTDYLILFSVLSIVFALIIFSLNPVSMGLFTGGFTASSVGIMIILAFQVFYGYVFSMVGIMIMLFMAGLALGSLQRIKISRKESIAGYIYLQITIGLFVLVFPFIIIGLHKSDLPDYINYSIMGLLTLVISFLAGMEYSVASFFQGHDTGRIVSKNYSADLFGSALGALLTSVFLLPLAGIIYTSLMLVFLNFISIVFLVVSFSLRKKYLSL
jgi:spermidine synthase